MHSMHFKKGRKGFLALRWNFLQDTLLDAGLPINFVKVVMNCISSLIIELTKSFQPFRELRQEDPLSPYLFVLCMERLVQSISQAISQSKWKPIQLNKGGPKQTNLFFADGLIIFAEASSSQVFIINRVLEDFCKISRQNINKAKT